MYSDAKKVTFRLKLNFNYLQTALIFSTLILIMDTKSSFVSKNALNKFAKNEVKKNRIAESWKI